MRVDVIIAIVVALLSVFSSGKVHAESSGAPKRPVQLASNDRSQSSTEHNPSGTEKSEGKNPYFSDLPSLLDLGLNLDSSQIVKQNDLDSLSVQPWTPGRSAVGVKIEVTW